MNKVFIIAEAGVNHNGSVKTAKKMIDAAVAARVDAVKFQTFNASELCCVSAQKADYQKKNKGNKETQFEMLKRLELDQDAHHQLMQYCKANGITFLSSPFDLDSIHFLSQLGMTIFKIPSGEITNLPYLERVGSIAQKIILSTGMADMEEIAFAVNTLFTSGMSLNAITLLHCCSQYPAPMDGVNLNAMKTMAQAFDKVKIGYSDHTQGIETAIAAVAMGACVIEKHFTLDRTMDGPDHMASIEPNELKGMVCAIRNIEKAMGDGIKRPGPVEIENKKVVRKSIVAGKNIKKGEKFSQDNLKIKRPGTGISPIEWYHVIGKTAQQNFKPDDLIVLNGNE
ncbi:MAG: N-acetylneuraminate synthase [Pseudomonadota bacterium]